MQGYKLRISGRWAHFRKPETNNNPLTHDFITKTALMGLMGAVLGIERNEMQQLYPVLSEDLAYGVAVRNAVKKQSWGFTMRNANKQNDPKEKAPRPMEFLRDPDYVVALSLRNERSSAVFTRFAAAVRDSEARYTPILGLHNCPAELEWIEEATFEPEQGDYLTKGFALRTHKPSKEFDPTRFRLGFERIPTYQDNEWWNRPDDYREVIYPSDGGDVALSGEHFRSSTGEAWCLI